MVNFIPDHNKFKLAGPPKWWLQRLHDFDPTLAVVPSRQGFFYRLAQRKKLSLPEQMAQGSLWHESDTQMLATYGLIPVTTIVATANWSNPFMFEELRRRSPHRMGGAAKITEQIEQAERDESDRKNAVIEDQTTQVAKDAWGMYLKKIGLRSQMYSPKVKKAAKQPSEARSAAIVIASR